jgi:hypothetical protein
MSDIRRIKEVVLDREDPFKPVIKLLDERGAIMGVRQVKPAEAWAEYCKTVTMVQEKAWKPKWEEACRTQDSTSTE